MRIRTTLLAGLAAGAALFASTAYAAPTQVITDAKGDAKGGLAAYDIVSVTMETTKTSKAKNAPLKDFRVVMELGAAPATQPGTSYQFFAESASCGRLFVYVYWALNLDPGVPGPQSTVQFSACGPVDPVTGDEENHFVEQHTFAIEGNKLVFSMPAKAMPSKMKSGMLFSDVLAFTALTEPAVGFTTMDFEDVLSSAVAEQGTLDVARGDKTYKYGS